MASDPADLIREADAALDGITPGPWEASGFDNMPHDVVQMEDDEHGTPWAVDQVAGQVKPRDAEFIAAAPDLVRRLRDALEATAGDACGTCLAIAREARKDASLFENLYDEARAALAEANATIERVEREVNMIAAHRTDWDDNGPEHDEWLVSLGEERLGGPDIAYRGIQYAVMRIRRAIDDGAPDPRRVETAEELDALPVGAIIRDQDEAMTKLHDARPGCHGWYCSTDHLESDPVNLPATVLWLPEGEP